MRTPTSTRFLLLLSSLVFFGCKSECELEDGKCPGGCDEVNARPVLVDGPSGPCTEDVALLACKEKGDAIGDLACVASPDGSRVYVTSVTSADRLIEEGYTSCTDEQREAADNTQPCP